MNCPNLLAIQSLIKLFVPIARTGTLLKTAHWKMTVSSAMSATLAWKDLVTQVTAMARWTVTRVQEVKNPIVFLEKQEG